MALGSFMRHGYCSSCLKGGDRLVATGGRKDRGRMEVEGCV